MFTLKRLSPDAVAAALEKALRYRLLNEPAEAESICLDVLAVDADNQEALVTLLLALTERFAKGYGVSDTRIHEVLDRIHGEYERAYYSGIVCERRGKATLGQGAPGSRHTAYEWFEDAMQWYGKAEILRPEGNDDALLRWNACARMIMRNKLTPRAEERVEHPLE